MAEATPSARRSDRRRHAPVALALGSGTLGGAAFAALGLPVPWLLGALAATTAVSLAGLELRLPDPLRRPMIAVLGAMLGTAFTPERLAGAIDWLPTLSALPLYVAVVGVVIYLYLRRCSSFDRTSAFFAAAPGGLSEMIALSQQLGGDQRRVSLVHATRLLFIVFAIPFLARAFGDVPAAAARAGPGLGGDPLGLGLLAALATLGYLLARWLRLPAATFVGPLFGSAAGHLAGVIQITPPYLVMAIAQLVIGASVGARFSGTPLALIGQTLLLGAGATAIMLLITLLFGEGLHLLTGYALILLLLAFIPGGLTEMSLVALALGVDPAFVVTHHSARVFLVILIALPAYSWLRRTGRLGAPTASAGPGAAPLPRPTDGSE
jgi:membrane AbrB-like protein